MPNEQNLIPNSERTPEQRKEMARNGGRASGIARRRKKSLKEAADLYLSLPVKDRRKRNAIAKKGVSEDDIDYQMAMIIGLTEKATKGDAKAARVIIDLLGESLSAGSKDEREDDPLTVALKEELEGGV